MSSLLRRKSAVAVLGYSLALVLVGGCATPEQRYRVLTFFFDPPPPKVVSLSPRAMEPPPGSVQKKAAEVVSAKLKNASIHEPYAKEACVDCHWSRFSSAMKAEGAELCWSCHKREKFPGKVVHGPTDAGECTACHLPHDSKYRFLLYTTPAEICDGCHDENTFGEKAQHIKEQGSDCLSCHNPHASDREYMLEAKVGAS